MAEADSARRRPNRRGSASRENLLEVALTALASGDPGAVSANRIAKEAGATWGTVQYQFGDTDGFWAAVLRYTAERRANHFAPPDTAASLRERVSRIIDTLYAGLTNRTRGPSRTCGPYCPARTPNSSGSTRRPLPS